jgi:hypothetical protein
VEVVDEVPVEVVVEVEVIVGVEVKATEKEVFH